MKREQTKSQYIAEAQHPQGKSTQKKRRLKKAGSATVGHGKEAASKEHRGPDLAPEAFEDEGELQKIMECWQAFMGDKAAGLPSTLEEFVREVGRALDGGEEFAKFLEDVLGTDPSLQAELEKIMRMSNLDEGKEEE